MAVLGQRRAKYVIVGSGHHCPIGMFHWNCALCFIAVQIVMGIELALTCGNMHLGFVCVTRGSCLVSALGILGFSYLLPNWRGSRSQPSLSSDSIHCSRTAEMSTISL